MHGETMKIYLYFNLHSEKLLGHKGLNAHRQLNKYKILQLLTAKGVNTSAKKLDHSIFISFVTSIQ